MTHYDRREDKTTYQMSFTPQELANLDVMTSYALQSGSGTRYIGCAVDGEEGRQCSIDATRLQSRIHAMALAAETIGRQRAIIERESGAGHD